MTRDDVLRDLDTVLGTNIYPPADVDPTATTRRIGSESVPVFSADSNGADPAVSAKLWHLLSTVEMRSIVFLEKPFWQLSAFHLIAGRKLVGKGTVIADLAARITLGKLGVKPVVIWIGTEDSESIDIRPRVEAAGGNSDLIACIDKWIQLPDDIPLIRTIIDEIQKEVGEVGLVVIDPVSNHMKGKRANDDTEVRDAIGQLNKLADDYELMVLGVRHLTEKEATAGLLAAVLGSSAWVHVPRAVIAIARDPQDSGVSHMQAFGNHLPEGTSGRKFEIEGVKLEGLEEEVTKVVWLGDSDKDVEQLFSEKRSPRVNKAELQALILRELETGEKSREYLDTVAKDELDANPGTVYKSGLEKLRLAEQVKAHKAGMTGGWYWSLPEEEPF